MSQLLCLNFGGDNHPSVRRCASKGRIWDIYVDLQQRIGRFVMKQICCPVLRYSYTFKSVYVSGITTMSKGNSVFWIFSNYYNVHRAETYLVEHQTSIHPALCFGVYIKRILEDVLTTKY